MSVHDRDLLLEIMLLIRRHSPEEWKKALSLLEDEDFREQMFSFLRTASKLSENKHPQESVARRRRAKGQSRRIDTYRGSDISTLISAQTTSRLRQMAKDFGLNTSPKDSRERLITRLRVSLSSQRTPVRRANLDSDRTRPSSGEYSKWVNIILGKSRPQV
jgi:hypothetical protein